MVFQSFEVQPFDYMLKPIQYDNFKKTMERLLLSMKSADKENLLIQRGTESSIVSFEEIIYCEIINRKIYLHLKSANIIDYYDRIENHQIPVSRLRSKDFSNVILQYMKEWI